MEGSESALEVLSRLGLARLKHSCGVEAVDEVVGGGLCPGEVYELVGELAVGKTQLFYAFAAQFLHSKKTHRLAWIDMNGSFRVDRLNQFLGESPDDQREYTDRVLISNVQDASTLLSRLDALSSSSEDLGIRMVLIDNIGSILQMTAWTLREGGAGIQRCVLSSLASLAEKGVTVLLSNHLVRANGEQRPALGRQWKEMIRRRILVGKGPESRYACVYEGANQEGMTFGRFKITDLGIQEFDDLSLALNDC